MREVRRDEARKEVVVITRSAMSVVAVGVRPRGKGFHSSLQKERAVTARPHPEQLQADDGK